MPCSHCNVYGHNIRTCWRYVEFKKEERIKAKLKARHREVTQPEKFNNKEKVLDEIKNILYKNAQLSDELKNTKAKLDDKTKAFEDLVNVNQELHQTIINKSASSEKWAIQTVLLSTKFKLAMKTVIDTLLHEIGHAMMGMGHGHSE